MRKILFIILIGLIAGFIAERLELKTLKGLSEAIFYTEDWHNYKVKNVEKLDENYSYIYDIISAVPLPEQVQIKEVEWRGADLHGKHKWVRIWLEVPDDEDLIRETLDTLEIPFKNDSYIYIGDAATIIGEPRQREFAKTDSGVIIEVLRTISRGIDTKYLPGDVLVNYYDEIPEVKMNSPIVKQITESEIYQAYRARENFKSVLSKISVCNFVAILINIGFIIADFLYKKELKKYNAQSSSR